MRTTIDQHISDLLYYHECVVVPGFGAFLTRYFSAEFHAATNMFRPPSKRVAFNARINENDGLLAKHVATVEGVSYQRALESISISVRSWQRILRSGKKINLHGVGRLFLDEEGLLQFNPAHDINYNIKSYGLNIFRATAMEREQKIKRSVNRAIENHKTSKGKRLTNTGDGPDKKNYLKYGGIAAGVAALVLVGGYLAYQPEARESISGFFTNIFVSEKVEGKEEGEASMVDSMSTKEAEETIEDRDLPDQKPSLDPEYSPKDDMYTNTEVEDEYNSSLYNLKEKPAGAASTPDAEDKTAPAIEYPATPKATSNRAEDDTRTSSPASSVNGLQPDYQIIVGSFSKVKNAEQYTESLQAKGFDAYIAGKYGMYSRVAIGRYNSQNAAMQELQKIRQQVNYNAWLNDN